MRKGIIVGLIALTLLVGAIFVANISAAEPDPELKFAGCNLSFADTIYVKYAVKGNDLSGVKLLIWTDPQTDYSYGSQNYVLNSIGTETVSGAQCLVFQYNKLAAKQMGDVIYARAFAEKQGIAYYSEVKKYSVLQYVYNKTGRTGTASTNQKLIDLLEVMLEYGAKAQIYTNYKTNRLVSSNYYQVNVVGGMLPDGCDSGLYALGEVVTLTAPSTDIEGNAFSYWENDDGENVGTTATLDVTAISRNRTYTAVYGVETPVTPEPEYSIGLAHTDNGDGTCTVTGIGTCTDLDVLIPPSIDGLTVSAIGEKAFENQTALTDIVIPDTVTSIGRRAFYGCTGLTEFTIPSSVTSIGTQIFFHADNINTVYYNASYYPSTETENQLLNNASIAKVVFNGTYISSYAARNLGMNGHVTEVEIGDDVSSIYYSAFYGFTSITNIEIPDNVSSVGEYAFQNCTNLTNVRVSATSIGYYAFQNLNNLETVILGDGVTSIGYGAFSGCTNLTSVEIPDSVTTIGQDAFDCSRLVNIYFTGTLSRWCSDFCSYSWNNGINLYIRGELLTDVVIPTDVTRLRSGAFYKCISIESVTMADNVTIIGDHSFGNCTNLKNATIGNGVTDIGENTFYECTSLESITIGNNVTGIGFQVFYGCTSLPYVVFPDGLTSIARQAFYNCTSLESIVIPCGVTSLNSKVFYNCTSLSNVEIPDSVTSIGEYAFGNCTGLSSIEIPDSVTSIGEYAFSNCTGLSSIEIPDSVTSIAKDAFLGCTNIECVNFIGTLGEWCGITFTSYAANPCYGGASLSFNGVLLTDAVITDSVAGIGQYAFQGCSSLVNVIVNAASIGSCSFYGCANIENVTLGDGVTSIGDSAFFNCTSLTEIIIPDGVASIGRYVFGDCSGIVRATVNSTSTGRDTFYKCTGLGSVVLGPNVTSIEQSAFNHCTSLTGITIPNKVISIGPYAFHYCTSLAEITIPDSVMSVGNGAFYGCTSLSDVWYQGNRDQWDNITIENENGPLISATIHYNDSYDDTGLAYYCNDDGTCTICGIGNCLEEDIVIPEVINGKAVTRIGESAFDGCTTITSVIIPNGVLSIGDKAFRGCTSITSVIISDSVTSIGGYTFRGCSNLAGITIGNGVTNIGGGAFFDCTSLTTIAIPTSVTSIGQSVFRGCTSLISVTIPYGVTNIEHRSFYGCTNLTSVTIPSSIMNIGEFAFFNCGRLKDIYFDGTDEQWNNITKGTSWDYNCNFTVHYADDNTP